MKQFLILILLAVCFIAQSFLSFSRTAVIYPICDSRETELPRNLRTALPINMKVSSLNLQGLNLLKISGSGQFSEKSFIAMLYSLPISPEKLVVVDLRQESHGFINGTAVSWTDGYYNYPNMHKTKSEVESDEYFRLRLAAQAKQIMIDPLNKPIKLAVYGVKTERNLVENHGAVYVRLPVTDHNRPSDDVIDQFIELVKNLSSDQWVHMHCKAGRGRTTTFLTLFDIMRNASHVSLKDILTRQHLIGGIDLTQVQKRDSEKERAARERLELVQKFYLYCREVPNFQVRWSDWIKAQRLLLVNDP